MATLDRGYTHLGDLVVAAFDEASLHSRESREASRLASRTVVAALMKEWTIGTQSPSLAAQGPARAHRGGDDSATTSTLTERIAGHADTAFAWSRLISQCGGASSALLGETTDTVRRAVVGGRAAW